MEAIYTNLRRLSYSPSIINIMHRDIKSANVFLYKNFVAKLGDLNVSKVMKASLWVTQTGTPYYSSPEVWKDQPYDFKSDIWSLGWVLYESLALKPPFRGKDMKELYQRVIRGKYHPIPFWYSKDLRKILRIMIVVDSEKRPTWEQLLNTKLIKKKKKALFMKDNPFLDNILLTTIKFPKNLMNLTERLPESQYSTNHTTKKLNSDQKKNKNGFPNLMVSEMKTSSNTREPPSKINSPEDQTYLILPGISKNSSPKKLKKSIKLKSNHNGKFLFLRR